MKKSILFFWFLLVSNSIWAQLNSLSFDYDPVGNQIVRELIHMQNKQSNNPESNTSVEYKKSDLYNDISYYPNPVKEELHVKWINSLDKNVDSVVIYNMTGQLIKQYIDLKNEEVLVVNFSSYPQGYYNLILIYKEGNQKTLKIVKD